MIKSLLKTLYVCIYTHRMYIYMYGLSEPCASHLGKFAQPSSLGGVPLQRRTLLRSGGNGTQWCGGLAAWPPVCACTGGSAVDGGERETENLRMRSRIEVGRGREGGKRGRV